MQYAHAPNFCDAIDRTAWGIDFYAHLRQANEAVEGKTLEPIAAKGFLTKVLSEAIHGPTLQIRKAQRHFAMSRVCGDP